MTQNLFPFPFAEPYPVQLEARSFAHCRIVASANNNNANETPAARAEDASPNVTAISLPTGAGKAMTLLSTALHAQNVIARQNLDRKAQQQQQPQDQQQQQHNDDDDGDRDETGRPRRLRRDTVSTMRYHLLVHIGPKIAEGTQQAGQAKRDRHSTAYMREQEVLRAKERALSSHIPRVIICARTHSQLKELTAELRRLPEARFDHEMSGLVSVVVMGSREELCCHPARFDRKNLNMQEFCLEARTKARNINNNNTPASEQQQKQQRQLVQQQLNQDAAGGGGGGGGGGWGALPGIPLTDNRTSKDKELSSVPGCEFFEGASKLAASIVAQGGIAQFRKFGVVKNSRGVPTPSQREQSSPSVAAALAQLLSEDDHDAFLKCFKNNTTTDNSTTATTTNSSAATLPAASSSQFLVKQEVKEVNDNDGDSVNDKTRIQQQLLSDIQAERGHRNLVPDIEDMQLYATKHGACPFYTTRILTRTQRILLCPYNYVFDQEIRDSVLGPPSESLLNNAILVVDEAHNIVDQLRSGTSFELSMTGLHMTAHMDLPRLFKSLSTKYINSDNYPREYKYKVHGKFDLVMLLRFAAVLAESVAEVIFDLHASDRWCRKRVLEQFPAAGEHSHSRPSVTGNDREPPAVDWPPQGSANVNVPGELNVRKLTGRELLSRVGKKVQQHTSTPLLGFTDPFAAFHNSNYNGNNKVVDLELLDAVAALCGAFSATCNPFSFIDQTLMSLPNFALCLLRLAQRPEDFACYRSSKKDNSDNNDYNNNNTSYTPMLTVRCLASNNGWRLLQEHKPLHTLLLSGTFPAVPLMNLHLSSMFRVLDQGQQLVVLPHNNNHWQHVSNDLLPAGFNREEVRLRLGASSTTKPEERVPASNELRVRYLHDPAAIARSFNFYRAGHVVDVAKRCNASILTRLVCKNNPTQHVMANLTSGNLLSAAAQSANKYDSRLLQRDLAFTLALLINSVPYGSLICFPSYTMLNTIFPLVQNEFATNPDFRGCRRVLLAESSGGNFKATMQEFRHAGAQPSGATLFIVCRGKVSEGVNLPQELCRLVVVVGVPLPNGMSPDVKATLDFEKARMRVDEWELQNEIAAVAVNQAVGRVLRSKNDWGSVVLLDCRYAAPACHDLKPEVRAALLEVVGVLRDNRASLLSPNLGKKLSLWLQPVLFPCGDVPSLTRQLADFSARMRRQTEEEEEAQRLERAGRIRDRHLQEQQNQQRRPDKLVFSGSNLFSEFNNNDGDDDDAMPVVKREIKQEVKQEIKREVKMEDANDDDDDNESSSSQQLFQLGHHQHQHNIAHPTPSQPAPSQPPPPAPPTQPPESADELLLRVYLSLEQPQDRSLFCQYSGFPHPHQQQQQQPTQIDSRGRAQTLISQYWGKQDAAAATAGFAADDDADVKEVVPRSDPFGGRPLVIPQPRQQQQQQQPSSQQSMVMMSRRTSSSSGLPGRITLQPVINVSSSDDDDVVDVG